MEKEKKTYLDHLVEKHNEKIQKKEGILPSKIIKNTPENFHNP